MDNTETIIIDYSNMKYYRELHTILRDALGWPKWYGCNLSALDDMLFSELLPRKIIFVGTNKIPREWESTWANILESFDKMIPEYEAEGNSFSYEIRS